MWFVWLIVVAVAWFIGILGWAQIVGSIQHVYERGTKATFTTIAIWVIILGSLTAVAYFVIPKYFIAYLIGLGASLIRILFAGRIH